MQPTALLYVLLQPQDATPYNSQVTVPLLSNGVLEKEHSLLLKAQKH